MKTDIILAGVGGQGILSIASILGAAALAENLFLKQAETHGMSQRGGAVVSHLRISDQAIASDLIPKGKADLILSVEPLEALRYLPFLAPDGYVVANTTPMLNVPDYPDIKKVIGEIERLAHYVVIDADKFAAEIGNKRASNVVMLGAAAPFIQIATEKVEAGIRQVFHKKGEAVVEMNLEAFRAGLEFARKNQ